MAKTKRFRIGLFKLAGPSKRVFRLLNNNDQGDYHSYANDTTEQYPEPESNVQRPTLNLTDCLTDVDSAASNDSRSTASGGYWLDHYESYDDERGEHTYAVYRNSDGRTLVLRPQDTPPPLATDSGSYSPGGFK